MTVLTAESADDVGDDVLTAESADDVLTADSADDEFTAESADDGTHGRVCR